MWQYGGTNADWQKGSIGKGGVTTLLNGTRACSQRLELPGVILTRIISNCFPYGSPPMFQSELHLIVVLLQKHILKGMSLPKKFTM